MDKDFKHINWDLLSKKLFNEASPEEINVLQEWASLNENNKKVLHKLEEILDYFDNYKKVSELNIKDALSKVKKPKQPIIKRQIRFFFKIAAVLILAFGLFFTVQQIHFHSNYVVIKTKEGERQTKVLHDGTEISLNENSKLIYPKQYELSSRNVTLKGEAYFSVTRNTEHPFIVEVNNAYVKVLGTIFNVNAKERASIKVIVTEGKVELAAKKEFKNNKILITSGNEGYYNVKENKMLLAETLNNNEIAWKTKILRFKNEKLEIITSTIEDVYNVSIQLDESVRNLKLSTLFNNQPIDSILEILSQTLNVEINKQENGEYLIIKK